MTEEKQREFFEEFKREKGRIKKIADKVAQGQRRFYLNVPVENAVFAVIIFIMCIIVSFAAGVEKGKRSSQAAMPSLAEANTAAGSDSEKTAQGPAEKTPVQPKMPEAPVVEGEAASEKPPYTIQVAVYKKESRAQKERKKLLSNGFVSEVSRAGDFYYVSAGSYTTVAEAEKDRKKLSKEYHDCFIRKKK